LVVVIWTPLLVSLLAGGELQPPGQSVRQRPAENIK
jgi:hypothetical protein